MKREATARRFFEAALQAFLGDGLPWNWSIWKKQFPTFTPILDFIHPLSYLFTAAKAVHPDSSADAWDQYQVWMTGCWRGEVGQVIAELQTWQERLGSPEKESPATDPRVVVKTTLRYLTNNQSRMKYHEYRTHGLPVTTAWMESLVKEMNYRVKGTEMFWPPEMTQAPPVPKPSSNSAPPPSATTAASYNIYPQDPVHLTSENRGRMRKSKADMHPNAGV